MPKVWTNLGWSLQDAYGPIADITATSASAPAVTAQLFRSRIFQEGQKLHPTCEEFGYVPCPPVSSKFVAEDASIV